MQLTDAKQAKKTRTFVDKQMSTKPTPKKPGKNGRPALRKSGKPYSDTERKRRWRANKEAKEKAAIEEARQTRRIEANHDLGILQLAIADVGEADLASGSASAVITDPPYDEADLPLHAELGRFALRVLKPGGWCLVMTGDLFHDRILTLMTPDLRYRGFIAVAFPAGQHCRIGPSRTYQASKLILLLQKPPLRKPPLWGPNLLVAPKNGHDKGLHKWQQSQPVFEKLVERFTVPGELVADPFAGSGTTLRAALALSRLSWGADVAL